MNAPLALPVACLLDQTVDRVRPLLRTGTTKQRIRILWAAAKKSRDLGSADVVHAAFVAVAVEADLIDKSGRWTGADVRPSVRPFGEEDVSHVIRWAMRGWNPFEKGPLI